MLSREAKDRAMKLINYFIVLLLISAHPFDGAACAQQPDEVIKLSTELVVLDAQVNDKNTGQPVGGLTKEDFVLYEDGVQQQITNFSQDRLPLSIILLLDVSGSVRPIIEEIGDGAVEALNRLKPEDEVAVMLFASETVLLQDFTVDRQIIAAKLAGIRQQARTAGGATLLNEAVFNAARHLQKAANPVSRRVIITITDNITNKRLFGNKHSEADAINQLYESGGVVCGLIVRSLFGQVNNVLIKSPDAILLRRIFRVGSVNKYAEKTGGEVLPASKQDIDSKLGELLSRLRARYSIGYVSTNTKQDGKYRRIKLKLAKSANANSIVKTKDGYYAPKQPQSKLCPAEVTGQGHQPAAYLSNLHLIPPRGRKTAPEYR